MLRVSAHVNCLADKYMSYGSVRADAVMRRSYDLDAPDMTEAQRQIMGWPDELPAMVELPSAGGGKLGRSPRASASTRHKL
jgi:hypothetical protein